MKVYEYTSELTAQNDLLKKINTRRILGLLRYYGRLTRQDIAEKTGLHISTVGLIERELRNIPHNSDQLTLIRRVESKEGMGSGPQGGRPKTILEINPRGAFFLGFAIRDNIISAVMLDLNGELIGDDEKEEFRSPDHPKDEVVDPTIIVQTICNLYKKILQGKDNKLLQGIGVAVPGNVKDGVVLRAPRLGWTGIDLRSALIEELGNEFESYLKKEFGEELEKKGFGEEIAENNKKNKQLIENYKKKFPLFIENDASVGAWAEMFNKIEEPVHSLFYLFLDEGLGAGMIVDRKLFQGAGGMACEVAELIIDTSQVVNELLKEYQGKPNILINKLREYQGRTFEDLCSEGSLLKAYQKYSGKSADDIRKELERNGNIANLLSELSRNKDVAAQKTIERWGKYLSSGTRQLVRLFNPERVVFGGRLSILIDAVKDQLNRDLKECLPNGTGYGFSNARFSLAVKKYSCSTKVESFIERDEAAIGAAILAHQSLIEMPDLSNLN